MNSNDHVENSGDRSCLIETVEKTHHSIPIIFALYCQLLLLILLTGGGFLLPLFYRNEGTKTTDSFSAVNYYNISIWVVITILTWYVKSEHKKSRILGYHEFYDATRHLHRVFFYIMCGGNVLLLIVSSVAHNYCIGGAVSPCGISISLSPVNYQQIILFFEFMCGLPLLIKHIVDVTRFNKQKASPDVLRDDSAFRINQNELLVGIRGPGNLERLLERQADQLMTLQHRNHILCQQVYALATQMEGVQNGQPTTVVMPE